jgi:D-amino-acid oxidase
VDDIVLGGTREPGRGRGEPESAVTESILERCRALEPRLAGCTVLDVRVGARPARPRVRVEAERRGDALVVHNYGHGGSGWTLCHGCAAEVERLVREAIVSRVR